MRNHISCYRCKFPQSCYRWKELGRDGVRCSASVSTFALRLSTSSYIAILNDLLSWTVGCCFTCSSATCARARSVRDRFDHQVLRGPFWATCGMGLSVEQRTSCSPAGHRPARVRGRVLGAREKCAGHVRLASGRRGSAAVLCERCWPVRFGGILNLL